MIAKLLPAVEPPPDLQPSSTVAKVPADNVPPMSKATLAIASLLSIYLSLLINSYKQKNKVNQFLNTPKFNRKITLIL